ncbi:MAG TPA: twin-arginine translocase subunit TatB [Gammaproteobacteria bacterium]|nr:twin-arginine translocase subunit TatB [Gammaproteobacteria bacterium]
MFNIHSTELLLVCVVALIVIGPEKLPGAIKTVSLWVGRFRRSFYKVKNEIERELNADEIRRQLHNESVLEDIEDAKSRMSELAKETERSVNNLVNSDTFDPGAVTPLKADDEDQETGQSAPEPSENPPEKTVVGEIPAFAEQIEEAEEATKEQLYGIGKNPKLSSNNDDDT